MTEEPLDDLAALLREEQAAILAGDWAALGPLGARKAACLEALERSPAVSLEPLAAGLGRSGALLRAALDGFREAARRGAMLRAARDGFATYDAAGARAGTGPAPRVERKA